MHSTTTFATTFTATATLQQETTIVIILTTTTVSCLNFVMPILHTVVIVISNYETSTKQVTVYLGVVTTTNLFWTSVVIRTTIPFNFEGKTKVASGLFSHVSITIISWFSAAIFNLYATILTTSHRLAINLGVVVFEACFYPSYISFKERQLHKKLFPPLLSYFIQYLLRITSSLHRSYVWNQSKCHLDNKCFPFWKN